MARVTVPIVIPEEDRMALEELRAHGNSESSLRAGIVLACSGTATIKDIANSLRTSEVTVRKWKTAYQKQGIKGLEEIHKGGRPVSKSKSRDIERIVLDAAAKDKNMDVHALAAELDVHERSIYYILKKNSVTLSRKRLWAYPAIDDMCSWNPPLTGIYLSHSCSILIASSVPCPAAWENSRGVLKTHNRLLVEELNRSTRPLGLQGILATAVDFMKKPGKRMQGVPKAKDAIEDVLSEWEGVEKAEFYIFASGNDVNYKGIGVNQCHLSAYESISEMKDGFVHWMAGRCSSSQHFALEVLAERIEQLALKIQECPGSFLWMLEKGSPADLEEAEPAEERHADEKTRATAPMQAEHWSGIEQMLTAMLPEMDDATASAGTEAGAILFQRESDGTIHYQLVNSPQRLQAYEGFDFATSQGFEHDMSRLEEDTEVLLAEVESQSYGMFLDAVKKTVIRRGVFESDR